MITLDRLVNVLAGSGTGSPVEPAGATSCCGAWSCTTRPIRAPPPATSSWPSGSTRRRRRSTWPSRRARPSCSSAPRRRSNPRSHDRRARGHRRRAGRPRGLVEPSHRLGLRAGPRGPRTESGRGPTDLFALADTLAAALRDSSVVIEDQLSRVLAYSSSDDVVDTVRSQTILGRRLPDRVRELFAERGVFRHLAASDEPLFVEPCRGARLRRAHGHRRAGGRSSWALGGRECRPSTPRAAGSSRTAHGPPRCTCCARARAPIWSVSESDLVTRLIEGSATPRPWSPARTARHGLRVWHCRPTWRTSSTRRPCWPSSTSTKGFGGLRPQCPVRVSYTLLPRGTTRSGPRVTGRVGARWFPDHVGLVAGIGGPPRPAVAGQPLEADASLAPHAARPELRPWRRQPSNRIVLVACELSPQRPACPARTGGRAQRAHRRHRTHHVETLRAWLAADGDIGAVAATLDVTETAQYHLGRSTRPSPRHRHPDQRSP